MMRLFPPPWTVEALDGGFKVVDANAQTLAYVYGHTDPRDAKLPRLFHLSFVDQFVEHIKGVNQ